MIYGHFPLRIDESVGGSAIYVTIMPDVSAEMVREAAFRDALPIIEAHNHPEVHVVCDNPALAVAFVLGALPALGGCEVIVNGRVAQKKR